MIFVAIFGSVYSVPVLYAEIVQTISQDGLKSVCGEPPDSGGKSIAPKPSQWVWTPNHKTLFEFYMYNTYIYCNSVYNVLCIYIYIHNIHIGIHVYPIKYFIISTNHPSIVLMPRKNVQRNALLSSSFVWCPTMTPQARLWNLENMGIWRVVHHWYYISNT